jgi:cytochrome c oxidase subunit 2
MNIPLFPQAASTTAAQTDELYFFLLGFSLFILAVVFLPMLYFLFKYRRGGRANRARINLPTMKIEIA